MMRERDETFLPWKQELRAATLQEVICWLYDHPGSTLNQAAAFFKHSKFWMETLRKDEMWSRIWYQVGRERLAPAVPKAIREVLAALDRGDPTATNLACKILENSGMLSGNNEVAEGAGGIMDYVQVEYLPVPPEPDFDALIAAGVAREKEWTGPDEARAKEWVETVSD